MLDLAYRVLVKEPLMVILPSDHRLAGLKSIAPRDLVSEPFVSNTAPVLRAVIDNFLKRSGIKIRPAHEADHLCRSGARLPKVEPVSILKLLLSKVDDLIARAAK
jgi:LysR family hca operon transcriptional activator